MENSLKYRRLLRKQGFYRNKSETECAKIIQSFNLQHTRRGYPDFSIIKDDEIVGFIEVKQLKETKLKDPQSRFGRFCKRNNIPFMKWTPDDGIASVGKFVAECLK